MAFDEAIRSIPGPRRDGNLVFGAHLLTEDQLDPEDIVFQSEQITPECPYVKPAYWQIMKNHEVWDYSPNNVAALQGHDIQAKLVPIRYSPCMTKEMPEVAEDDKLIDVLFYGSMNPRRKEIIDELGKHVRVRGLFGVYGKYLDQFIAQSKIVLNLHAYDAAIFEIFRCSHLFANKAFVVSETGKDQALEAPYKDCAHFCKYDEIVDHCLSLLKEDGYRCAQAELAFSKFKMPTLVEELKTRLA